MQKSKTIHIISQAHLDLAWLWTWKESWSEALNNLHSVTRLMDKYEDLKFSYSSSILYQWVQESSPRLFETVSRLVQSGRLEIVGGWTVEPDCNIPSGESFVRQALYGKSFFRKHFGVGVDTAYNPDAFGHGGGLPQILVESDFKHYVFSKPRYSVEKFPVLFWWESPNGSRILTWRVTPPFGYATGPELTSEELGQSLREVADGFFPAETSHTTFFLGVGDHGGGPSEAHIKKIMQLQEDPDFPELRFSTFTEFFQCLKTEVDLNTIPVHKGDIGHHNIGCYSAMGDIKRINRLSEISLANAEVTSALTCMKNSLPYPEKKIRQSWQEVLFHQFHDIIAGTCTPKCYEEAFNALGSVLNTATKINSRALHSIAQTVDTSHLNHNALFVFNPFPWPRQCLVEMDMYTAIDGARGKPIESIYDSESGKLLPTQWTRADSPYGPWMKEWKKLLVSAYIPACGYKVLEYSTKKAAPNKTEDTKEVPFLQVSTLANEFGTKINGSNPDGTEFEACVRLLVIKDDSDTFGHDRTRFLNVEDEIKLEGTHTIETGPLRTNVRLTGSLNESRITMDIVTYTGCDLVDFFISGEWLEKNSILKFEVSSTLKEPSAYFEMPCYMAKRNLDGEESPGHSWAALHGEAGTGNAMLAVINSGQYSHDAIDSSLHVILRRSVSFMHYGSCTNDPHFNKLFMDQGEFRTHLRIVAKAGEWQSQWAYQEATNFQSKAHVIADTQHAGTEAMTDSFLEILSDHVQLMALKQHESGNGWILRLFETGGIKDTVCIRFVLLDYLIEETILSWQIITLHLTQENGIWQHRVISMLE